MAHLVSFNKSLTWKVYIWIPVDVSLLSNWPILNSLLTFRQLRQKEDGKKNILLFIGVYHIYSIEENIFTYFYHDPKNNVGVTFWHRWHVNWRGVHFPEKRIRLADRVGRRLLNKPIKWTRLWNVT